MKVYAVKDEYDKAGREAAYLVYYEKSKRFYIELPEDADEWNSPLLLSSFAAKGIRSINSYWSRKWVEQRIIPQDRQNIGMILRDNRLPEYDEFLLLVAGHGRCAQDNYYIRAVPERELLERFRNRYEYKVHAVVPLNNFRVMVFFRNGYTGKCDIKKMKKNNRTFGRVLSDQEVFNGVTLQPGGYGITFHDDVDISDYELYAASVRVDVSLEEFKAFVRNNIVSTAEVSELLNCSRQYIDEKVKKGELTPIKTMAKNRLFLKSDLQEGQLPV